MLIERKLYCIWVSEKGYQGVFCCKQLNVRISNFFNPVQNCKNCPNSLYIDMSQDILLQDVCYKDVNVCKYNFGKGLGSKLFCPKTRCKMPIFHRYIMP